MINDLIGNKLCIYLFIMSVEIYLCTTNVKYELRKAVCIIGSIATRINNYIMRLSVSHSFIGKCPFIQN